VSTKMNSCASSRRINESRANERREERTSFSVPVQIISHGAFTQERARGICIDFSEAGVAFLTEANLNLADIAELIFEPNDQPAFSHYVRLIYRIGHRYGAYISHMD